MKPMKRAPINIRSNLIFHHE